MAQPTSIQVTALPIQMNHSDAVRAPEVTMLHIEHDDDAGCFMLLDDGIGIAKSKSRNSLVRIRDALNAVRETGLVGLTVQRVKDTVPNRINGYPCGVVLALCSGPPQFVIRLPDGKLDVWPVIDCQIIEPERPDKPTPWNDPAIGVLPAVDLLKRFVACPMDMMSRELVAVVEDTKKFLAARVAAEPSP